MFYGACSEPANPPYGKRGTGRWNNGGWNGKIIAVGNGDHLKALQNELCGNDARYTVWEPLVKDQQQEAGN
jgi:hypothetical protein